MSDKSILDGLSFTEVSEKDKPAPRKASKPRTKVTAPPYREGALIEPLSKLYATGALGLMPFAPLTAEALMLNAEACAKAWDEWARTSPTVRRLLYPLINASAGAAVLGAHLPIAMAVVMELRPGTPFANAMEGYLSGGTEEANGESAN